MAARITTKVIRIMGPEIDSYPGETGVERARKFDEANQEVHDRFDWGSLEDEINGHLPEGYYAKVDG